MSRINNRNNICIISANEKPIRLTINISKIIWNIINAKNIFPQLLCSNFMYTSFYHFPRSWILFYKYLYFFMIQTISKWFICTEMDSPSFLRISWQKSYFCKIHLESVEEWWNKVKPETCWQITFNLQRSGCPIVYICNQQLPEANEVRYLGLLPDSRLT